MESEQLAKLSISDASHVRLPNELLIEIFSYHQLPGAAAIGQARYETLNIPKGPLLQSPIKSYVDNELFTGACTHQHDEWKASLRTLSAISKASHLFRQLAIPLLYRVCPGQALVKPQLFLRSCYSHPDFATHVKEMVVDAWNGMNQKNMAFRMMNKLDFGRKLIATLKHHAREWNDEEHAILLLFHCVNVSILDITCTSAWSNDSAMSLFFARVRELDDNTNGEAETDEQSSALDKPLRTLNELHLHHAENMYVRSIDSFEPLMRVQGVKRLTAYRFWDGGAALGKLGHLQQLMLWRCSFKQRELLAGLAACVNLESLHIILAGFKAVLSKLIPEDEPVDYAALGKIVRSKLKKLRVLHIDDREMQAMGPLRFGSFKSGPLLEELAVNEAALGCYDVDEQSAKANAPGNKGVAAMARFQLSDMLPTSLRSLSILRSDLWWHESDNGGQPLSHVNDQTGLVYESNAIRDKVFKLISEDLSDYAYLNSVHIDTPQAFGKDVAKLGWRSERVLGDPKLAKPSIVTNSLMTPKEKKTWEKAQRQRAAEPSVFLRRGL